MSSLPLTLIESPPTNDKIQIAEIQSHEMGLPSLWTSGLEQLKQVCDHASKVNREQRLMVTQACQQIANHIGEAGLQALELPRDYEVRSIDRHWVMVKCFPSLRLSEIDESHASHDSSGREVRFVASGEESLWTRFNLQVTRLTDSQVNELVADLESGLIGEIISWVESHTKMPPASGPMASDPETFSTPATLQNALPEQNRLRLVDLGRSKRHPSRSNPNEPIRRVA